MSLLIATAKDILFLQNLAVPVYPLREIGQKKSPLLSKRAFHYFILEAYYLLIVILCITLPFSVFKLMK